MEQIKLKATVRDGRGKQAVRKLRENGLVPAVVYHRGEESVPITLEEREISRIVHKHGNENVLISLTIEKEKKTADGGSERGRGKSRAVIIKEIQHDPVKLDILHVDFHEISLTEKITVEVEVLAKGEPAGVKLEGGFLDHPLRVVKIQCLPTDIPPHLEADISGLKMNDVFYVKDLVVSEKVKVLTDAGALLFKVVKHEEKVEEAAPAETPEVEVIREKKEEEGAVPAEKKEEAKAEPKAEKK